MKNPTTIPTKKEGERRSKEVYYKILSFNSFID